MTARQNEYVRQACAALADKWEQCSRDEQRRRAAQLLVRHIKTVDGCPTEATTGLPGAADGEGPDCLLRTAQRMYLAF